MKEDKKYIPYNLPFIEKDEIREVVDSLKSGWLTTGPKTKQFEADFSKYVGAKNAIALSSCTAGLHLSLLVAGIKRGDEVVTTPYTFASTILAIMEAGAKPVLVDIREDTLNINEKKIAEKLNAKTKAILPVHFGGIPCEMSIILGMAKRNGLYVIEDAAHAVGSEYEGYKVGKLGDLTAFSFYATKNLTTGEGGMVTTDNDEYAEKIRVLSLHGISKDSFNRYARGGSWYYEVKERGFKYNMMDIQAALGLHQLKKLDKMNKRRGEIAEIYNSCFSEINELAVNELPDNIRNSWHLYLLHLNLHKLNINRNDFILELRKRKIGASVHFIPAHYHPYFQRTLKLKPGAFPVCESVYERVISLPLYPSLKDADANHVIRAVKDIIVKNKKMTKGSAG